VATSLACKFLDVDILFFLIMLISCCRGVVTGKSGKTYWLNLDNLGGYQNGPNKLDDVIQVYQNENSVYAGGEQMIISMHRVYSLTNCSWRLPPRRGLHLHQCDTIPNTCLQVLLQQWSPILQQDRRLTRGQRLHPWCWPWHSHFLERSARHRSRLDL
jgi:hypothetical protein